MNDVDPTADTVPCPDAPCDVGGCKEPWKHAIPATAISKDGKQSADVTLYVCPAHFEEYLRDSRVD